MTIRRYRRSQPEPQLALMVRAFPACRQQRPSWPGPSASASPAEAARLYRRWRDTTAFSSWPGREIPGPARACWRTSRRPVRASAWTAAARVRTPGRDRGDSAVECPPPARPRPAAPGGGSPGCRLVTRPSSSQRHHTPSASVNSANAVISASARAATGCGLRCVSWVKTRAGQGGQRAAARTGHRRAARWPCAAPGHLPPGHQRHNGPERHERPPRHTRL
jgi:hypothetical protein